jgi:hypothetical protein
MSFGRRFVVLGLGGVVAWYLCTLVFWAFQPPTDHVPVGIDYTRNTPQIVSVPVECNTLFRSASRANSPLPTLTVQPDGKPPLAYAYDPCSRTHREARMLFAIDTAVVLGGLALAVWLGMRSFDVPAAVIPKP